MLNDDELLHTGKVDGQPADVFPFAITRADLDRGEERFNIYCSPCHGRTGEGNGMVVQRGYRQAAVVPHRSAARRRRPATSSTSSPTASARCRTTARRFTVDDRWRIVAYVRALQLSHSATTADVPAAELERAEERRAGARRAAAPAAAAAGDTQ